MIVWRGFGILAILIPFGCTILIQLLLGETFTFTGLGYIIGAIPVWYLGKKWNGNLPEKSEKHSLFWIHMEYWAFIFVLIGSTLIVDKIIELKASVLVPIWLIGAIILFIYQNRKVKVTDLVKNINPSKAKKTEMVSNETVSIDKKINKSSLRKNNDSSNLRESKKY